MNTLHCTHDGVASWAAAGRCAPVVIACKSIRTGWGVGGRGCSPRGGNAQDGEGRSEVTHD